MAEEKPNRRAHNFKDLTGLTFGRLEVLSLNRVVGRKAYWNCRCSCKTDCVVGRSNLTQGLCRSCGCLKEDSTRARRTTHGMYRSKTYYAWQGAKDRCFNPNNTGFINYGGRGITMCDEWRDSFEAFYRDMGPVPTGLSLDRIDVNGPYSKENCRWTDRGSQNRNTRRTILITHNGETLCLKDWADKSGVSYRILLYRYHAGLPVLAE
jgi:hypothetical protein